MNVGKGKRQRLIVTFCIECTIITVDLLICLNIHVSEHPLYTSGIIWYWCNYYSWLAVSTMWLEGVTQIINLVLCKTERLVKETCFHIVHVLLSNNSKHVWHASWSNNMTMNKYKYLLMTQWLAMLAQGPCRPYTLTMATNTTRQTTKISYLGLLWVILTIHTRLK